MIDHGRGSAKRRSFVTRVMVIRGNRAKHWQIEVHMRIDPAWHDQPAVRVDDVSVRMLEVPPNKRDLFVFDQNVCLKGFGGSDQGAVFDESIHFLLQLLFMKSGSSPQGVLTDSYPNPGASSWTAQCLFVRLFQLLDPQQCN